MEIILGSGSPRRKEILESVFGNLEITVPDVDESMFAYESAEGYTRRITELKLESILHRFNMKDNYCLITSDTIVVIDGDILGKPSCRIDAVSMLQRLSGREHYVLTGACIGLKMNNEFRMLYDCEKTYVKFKKLDENQIEDYLNSIDYSDKAGSYAIQEYGEMIVEKISGSITNVIGFPLRLFFKMTMSQGILDYL